MHWRFRKLKYDILIPKLGKNIFQLSEKEAEELKNLIDQHKEG